MALALTRQERQQSHIHRWLQQRKPAFGPEFSPGPVIDKRRCDQARHGYRKARTRREVPTSASTSVRVRYEPAAAIPPLKCAVTSGEGGLAQSGWNDVTNLAEFVAHLIEGLSGLS